jgi:hypothetical protein
MIRSYQLHHTLQTPPPLFFTSLIPGVIVWGGMGLYLFTQIKVLLWSVRKKSYLCTLLDSEYYSSLSKKCEMHGLGENIQCNVLYITIAWPRLARETKECKNIYINVSNLAANILDDDA